MTNLYRNYNDWHFKSPMKCSHRKRLRDPSMNDEVWWLRCNKLLQVIALRSTYFIHRISLSNSAVCLENSPERSVFNDPVLRMKSIGEDFEVSFPDSERKRAGESADGQWAGTSEQYAIFENLFCCIADLGFYRIIQISASFFSTLSYWHKAAVQRVTSPRPRSSAYWPGLHRICNLPI